MIEQDWTEEQALAADAVDTLNRVATRVAQGDGTELDFDVLVATANFAAEWLATHYGLSESTMDATEVDDFVEFILTGGEDVGNR